MLSKTEKTDLKIMLEGDFFNIEKLLISLYKIRLSYFNEIVNYILSNGTNKEQSIIFKILIKLFRAEEKAKIKKLNLNFKDSYFINFFTKDYLSNETELFKIHNSKNLTNLIEVLYYFFDNKNFEIILKSIENNVQNINVDYIDMLNNNKNILRYSKFSDEKCFEEILIFLLGTKYEKKESRERDFEVLNYLTGEVLNKNDYLEEKLIKYILENKEKFLKNQPLITLSSLCSFGYRATKENAVFFFEKIASLLNEITEQEMINLTEKYKELKIIENSYKLIVSEDKIAQMVLFDAYSIILNSYFSLFNAKDAYFEIKDMKLNIVLNLNKEVLKSYNIRETFEEPFEKNEISLNINHSNKVNCALIFEPLRKINMPYVKGLPLEYISYFENSKEILRNITDFNKKQMSVDVHGLPTGIGDYLNQKSLIESLSPIFLLRLMKDFPNISFDPSRADGDLNLNKNFFDDLFLFLDSNLTISEENYDYLLLNYKT